MRTEHGVQRRAFVTQPNLGPNLRAQRRINDSTGCTSGAIGSDLISDLPQASPTDRVKEERPNQHHAPSYLAFQRDTEPFSLLGPRRFTSLLATNEELEDHANLSFIPTHSYFSLCLRHWPQNGSSSVVLKHISSRARMHVLKRPKQTNHMS